MFSNMHTSINFLLLKVLSIIMVLGNIDGDDVIVKVLANHLV